MARTTQSPHTGNEPAVVLLVENEHHRVEEYWRSLVDSSGTPRRHALAAPTLPFPAQMLPYVIFVPSPEQEGQVHYLRRELATDRILFDPQGYWEPTAVYELLDDVIRRHPGARFLVLWDDHLNTHYTRASNGMSLSLAQRFRERLGSWPASPDVEICGISAHGSAPAHTQEIVSSVRAHILSDYRDRTDLDRYIAEHFAAPRLPVRARIGGVVQKPARLSRDDIGGLHEQIRESVIQRLAALGRALKEDPSLRHRVRLDERDPVYNSGFVLDGPERSLRILEHRERDPWYAECVEAGRKRDWPNFYRQRLMSWLLEELDSLPAALTWTDLRGGPFDDLSDLHSRTFLHIVTHDGWHTSADLIRQADLEFGTFGDQTSTLRARIAKFREDVGRREILASDRAFGYRCFQDYLLVGIPSPK